MQLRNDRLLAVAELMRQMPPPTLYDIADRISLTVKNARPYARELQRRGMCRRDNGRYIWIAGARIPTEWQPPPAPKQQPNAPCTWFSALANK